MNRPLSRNDAKLAHGVASHQIKVGMDDACAFIIEMQRFLWRGKAMSVKDVERTIAKHFSQYLVHRKIEKATGSRNKAAWVFLFPSKKHNDYGVFLLELFKNQIYPDLVAIRINAHAIARTYQRSTGNGDLKEVIKLLHDHIGFMLIVLGRVRSGELKIPYGMSTYSKAGKMLWVYEDERVIGKTWIDADQFGVKDMKDIKESGVDFANSALGIYHQDAD